MKDSMNNKTETTNTLELELTVVVKVDVEHYPSFEDIQKLAIDNIDKGDFGYSIDYAKRKPNGRA